MKKIGIFLVIIGLLIIGLFSFFSKPEEKEKYIPLNIEDERVKLLYEMANPTENVSIIRDVYLKNTFSNEFILGASLVSIIKDNPIEQVSEEQLNEKIKKIFGSVTYAHDSGFIMSDLFCAFHYDKNNHLYTFIKDCEDKSDTKILRKIVEAKKSETEYLIKEKMLFVTSNLEEVKANNETTVTIKVYNDLEQSKLLYETSYEWDTETPPVIRVEDYLESSSTYEYNFSFDGESFIYKSLKRVD